MRQAALTAVLVAVALTVLAANIVEAAFLDAVARVLFVVLCLLGLVSSTLREALLLAVSVILAVLMYLGEGRAVLPQAIDLASYFAAFIVMLTVLKIAADRSGSVLAVGRYLIRQPSGRRFVATAAGGHVLGVFLNFAAISLMAPLIQNATKHADGRTDTALERRQLSALLRGFAWILLWAPTTLSQAVLLTLMTDIDYGRVLMIGTVTALAMMGIGLLYDRWEWRHVTAPLVEPQAPVLPRRALSVVACVCAVLIVATAIVQVGAGVSTALALMVVAPSVTLMWFLAERDAAVSLMAQAGRFWPALRGDAAGLTRSAMALGLSGFIGRSLAEVLPVGALVSGWDLAAVPGWLFLAVLPVLITLGGQVALSPIILVVFLGQIIQTMPVLPADPAHIVFALSAGWSISMFASPNATATLLISATSKIPPTVLTWRWNLRYGLVCYGVLVIIFALLEH